jgi:PIN domain nuclease of toxin-antitoxin system
LSVTLEHGLLAGRLDWEHRDPFDRMLVAQATIENVPLVSKDSAMAASGVRLIW